MAFPSTAGSGRSGGVLLPLHSRSSDSAPATADMFRRCGAEQARLITVSAWIQDQTNTPSAVLGGRGAHVVSWNMNQAAPRRLETPAVAGPTDVAAALVQEAKNRNSFRTVGEPTRHSTTTSGGGSRSPASTGADGTINQTRRWFASAIVATGDRLIAPREPVELHQVVDGGFACSHPGQFAVGDIDLDDGRRLTVVSLYGIWDRMTDRATCSSKPPCTERSRTSPSYSRNEPPPTSWSPVTSTSTPTPTARCGVTAA